MGLPAKIIVADDNRDAADALAALIGAMGFEAAVAYGGQEAVDACEAERSALVILDVEMPRMDGCEAARPMRLAEHPPAFIASLSGARLDEEPLRSRCSVFDARLTKPADFEELSALLSARAR